MDRKPELHISALSPAEYAAYTRYLELLDRSGAKIGADGTARFERAAVLKFLGRLGAPTGMGEEVLDRIGLKSLAAGHVYAAFRLLAHATKGRGTDLKLVFEPVNPLPLDPKPPAPPPAPPRRTVSLTAASKGARRNSRARPSLPASALSTPPKPSKPRIDTSFLSPTPASPAVGQPWPSRAHRKSMPAGTSMDPFSDAMSPSPEASPMKPRARSTTPLMVGSNNPFRKSLSAAGDRTGTGRTGPPLPPRRSSVRKPGPALPPRSSARARADSASSTWSDQPTSQREASSIMQQSLAAAAAAGDGTRTHRDVTFQVIKSTLAPPPKRATAAPESEQRRVSGPREIIEHVTRAVRESEREAAASPRAQRTNQQATAFDKEAARQRKTHPNIKTWSAAGLLADKPLPTAFAMIILNQPITRKDTLHRAWEASTLRLCADGGANRLYDALTTEEREDMLPSMIKGDLDSLRSDVRQFYASKGVEIKRDPSEYSTDLQKCIEEVETVEKDTKEKYSLLFLGGLSGRLDQTLHVLAVLYKSRRDIYVISEESLAWVLDKGEHLIDIDHSTMGQTCGILPIGGAAFVRTEGLKWDLDWETSILGDMSTSNHLLPGLNVLVETSAPVVWTVEIRRLDKKQRRLSIESSDGEEVGDLGDGENEDDGEEEQRFTGREKGKGRAVHDSDSESDAPEGYSMLY